VRRPNRGLRGWEGRVGKTTNRNSGKLWRRFPIPENGRATFRAEMIFHLAPSQGLLTKISVRFVRETGKIIRPVGFLCRWPARIASNISAKCGIIVSMISCTDNEPDDRSQHSHEASNKDNQHSLTTAERTTRAMLISTSFLRKSHRSPGSLLPTAVSQWIPGTQGRTQAKRRIGAPIPS
jgi:hypothetical protein